MEGHLSEVTEMITSAGKKSNGEEDRNEAEPEERGMGGRPGVRRGVPGSTHHTCSLIFFPSMSTVRILKSMPGGGEGTCQLRGGVRVHKCAVGDGNGAATLLEV